ncbi:MAG: formimidoylglutamate deiminase [Myxococcota bacterium]|nr:formimidoylglutamate deiminase [Myxococcota bacterium]MEE2779679.1 formimidoylglutamate deiminase [Myxococcota bacterium]
MTTEMIALPGMANAHSHAFQRLLRGSVQRRAVGREDTFWTWRESMYDLACGLDLRGLEEASRLCFVECLEAGYTAVGEFHYVHNQPDGSPYEDPVATSRAVQRAASQAGIRLCLLWTVYARGGFDAPLQDRQRRFGAPDLDHVRRCLDSLAGDMTGDLARAGLAIHSVRAVPRDWLGPLAEEAAVRDLPLHVHVSEQPQEVADCLEATGLTPIGLLQHEGVLSPTCTLVHATWLEGSDLSLIADSGASVCICPTTEGDLGDGFPQTEGLRQAGVPLCVGSDSHAVIDPWAELRTLEYQARAREGRRCVITDAAGEVAPALLTVGHANGYAALGLPSAGDRVLLDGTARVFEGVTDAAGAAVTAGHPGLVRRVEVNGEVVVDNGRHLG